MPQQRQSCYMCDKPATSKEHVPPNCFFPEAKDLGRDYKKNLITVPACDDHNLGKSKDDEYLLAVVVNHWQNNNIAYSHSVTKLKRALQHSKKYFDLLFKPDNVDLVSWNSEKLVIVGVDIRRVNSSLQKIACGLYFHHFQTKWLGVVDIEHISLLGIHPQVHPVTDALAHLRQQMRLFCAKKPRNGTNPDIFFYQIAHDDPPTDIWMRMVFYTGFEAMAMLSNASSQPTASQKAR